MIKLLWYQLRKSLPMLAMISCGLGIASLLMRTNILIYLSPAFFVIALSVGFYRSGWYLNLPWSRRKIASQFVLELFSISFLTSLFPLATAFVTAADSAKLTEKLLIIFFSLVFGNYIATWRILAGTRVAPTRPKLQSGWKSIAVAALCLPVIAAAILIFQVDEEPVVLLAGALGLAVLPLILMAAQLGFPAENLRFVSRVAGAVLIFGWAGAVTLAYGFAHFGDAKSAMPNYALKLLNRLPVFLSEDRAVELFKSPIDDAPAFNRRRARIAARVTEQEWLSRTSHCSSSECLSLSSRGPKDKFTALEVSERFAALLAHCAFTLGEKGDASCSKLLLPEEELKQWLELINKTGVVDAWLVSPKNSALQIAALKSLPKDTTPERLGVIRSLAESKDPLVATAARRALRFHSEFAQKSYSCDEKKFGRTAVCDWATRGPASLF